MSKISSFDVRERFTGYFKKQGHTVVPSSSLIPEDDPTLLFTNAGMNQFKNVFLGLEKRDYTRAVSVQKCVRAGGKHNDLENVGFTARHHTFFEMLGNFSFGDYFKKEAIHFAWDFLTRDLAIPKEKLYVTVFETDEEAAEIWHRQEGVPKDRIFRFGEKDNFWRMGETGPCGPCSEIFYDHGPKAGTISDPYKGIVSGEDRFVEIWNLVFMQFFEKSPGVMDPLPRPSVDTGSGLERMVAALQGKINNFDTDLFSYLIDHACGMAGLKREKLRPDELAALRVMADHGRASSFLIADGALPSNEGRGYVLRRILRRAIRYGRKLSDRTSFMPELSRLLIENMGSVYPELRQRENVILPTIKDEEARFLQTLDTGTALLQQEFEKLKKRNERKLPSDFVFKLYDTYGFPFDLTRLMAGEQGFQVDEAEFEEHMEKARKLAQASWKGKGLDADEGHVISWAQSVPDRYKVTRFVGYETMVQDSELVALSNGRENVKTLEDGQQGFLIAATTPFYAEGGGQVGDRGRIRGPAGEAVVENTTKQQNVYIHHIRVTKGKLSVGEKITLEVESTARRLTAANHSATHLLHAALRKVLGSHVTQAGSLVDAAKLRFDFTHNKALIAEELRQIEDLVNQQISLSINVEPKIMSYKEAITSGAMALFGEKYGDEVRVLRMGDFSTELCGGTHVSNTSQIRLFKIVSESGVSAGVRRIEALTSDNALRYLKKHEEENQRARAAIGLAESWTTFLESKAEVADWIANAKAEVKNLEKAVKAAKSSQVNLDELVKGAEAFSAKGGGHRLVTWAADSDDRELLAQWTDQLKSKIQSGVVVVLGKGNGTHPLIVAVTKNLNPELAAGKLLKEAAQAMGGKGGGRPDFAQGAVTQPESWPKAVETIRQQLGMK